MAAEWIWYPGEFETRTVNLVNARRYYRDIPQPPVWKSHGIYPSVKFARQFTLERPEKIELQASGIFNVELDKPGNFVECNGSLELGAGRHALTVHVFAENGKIPALYVSGETLFSGADWYCTLLDGRFVHAACGGFADRDGDPNDYRLPVEKKVPTSVIRRNGYLLYDFSEESFGFLVFDRTNASGTLEIYYGESIEEAEDFGYCEQLDRLPLGGGRVRTRIAKAFRYVAVVPREGAEYGEFFAETEYNPRAFTSEFSTGSGEFDGIWNTSLRTFALNTREFFLDGIKRDRWVWSGDATQSYLINKYCSFDTLTERRTMIALCGKGEILGHFNTITDYTLYWLISFFDYYRYTGDLVFIKTWYDRFLQIMEFCNGRTDENGLLKSPKGEWVFIDWNDAVTKDSECYAFIQMLFYGALCAAAKVSELVGDGAASQTYHAMAEKVKAKTRELFWSEQKGGFTHSLINGGSDGLILRQNNIMAILQGVADERESRIILEKVLLNDDVPAITTPYMRFYEFSALCELGQTERVAQEMKNYYQGMLDLGATSFWEFYDPTESGTEHLAMYGRKYGKSLCHAWGATPIYIIGRYFIGLSPEKDGYDRFLLKPELDVLGNFKAVLPLKNGGKITITRSGNELTVSADREGSVLAAGNKFDVRANEIKRIALDII